MRGIFKSKILLSRKDKNTFYRYDNLTLSNTTYAYLASLTPKCSALPCPEFAIQNGTVRHSGGTIQPGQSVLVSCDENFELIGSARVTCVAGESTSTKPTCERKCTVYSRVFFIRFH